MTYSQNEEDTYILEAVADIQIGTVLDIGAWHSTDKSNSRALIEKGWKAVLVEPSPGPFRELLKAYGTNPLIKLMNCAVGASASGFREFYITDDGVTTCDPELYDRWQNDAAFHGTAFIWTANWKDLGVWDADVISIDTEGSSIELWLSMSNFLTPRVWCVEFDGNQSRKDIQAIANGRACDVVYESNENLVMKRRITDDFSALPVARASPNP